MQVIVIALLALLLLATPPASADVKTCPGGPLFGFAPGSDRLDARTEAMLATYIKNLAVPLWRSGWITVSPTVLGRVDAQAILLAERRERTISRRLRQRGLESDRVRFGGLRSASPTEADADVYPSTLSTPEAVWRRLVTPGIMC
jgi:hypothetical protein